MKYIVVLLIILKAHGCQQTKVQTYQEGLANCKRVFAEKLKEKENSERILSKPDCLIGAQIPDFLATTIEGKHLTKPQLMGKITILNFWFIGCAPCVAEIPGFNAIVEKYGNDRINYIAIGKDDTHDIQQFLKKHPKHPWKFEHIPNGEELMETNFRLGWGFPTTFVLDKNATIIAAFSGGKADERAIEEIQKKLIPVIDKELKRRPRNRKTKS